MKKGGLSKYKSTERILNNSINRYLIPIKNCHIALGISHEAMQYSWSE